MIGNRNVDNSYRTAKIQFSENSGRIKSVRSASEAFKLYFDASIMDAIAEFIDTHKDELR